MVRGDGTRSAGRAGAASAGGVVRARSAASGRGAASAGGVVRAAHARIFRAARAIPRGRVMTYGQVARAAGMPRGARVVGQAMALSAGRSVPWHRVLGQRRPGWAHITIGAPVLAARQRQLLEREGVRFDETGAIDLGWFGHAPRGPRRADLAPRKRAAGGKSRPAAQ